MNEKEMMRAALIMLLKRKRQGMTTVERAKRKKPARWLYPWATEHGYAVLIRAWVKPTIVFVREYIQKHHEAVLRGDGADAVIRNDAVAGRSFQLMFESLWNWCDIYISNKDNEKAKSQIWLGLGRIADEAFDFNGAQFDKAFKASLGIEFPSDQSWWPDARDLWRERNYEIIRSDIRKYISDINTATERAVTNGLSVKSLMKEIQALDEKITKSRANFIARDQIGKLNGMMTQKRQEDIGLSMYEWSSSGDERVRSSHALMDGKLCRWGDATVFSEDGGKTWKPRPMGAVLMHPGQDFQCRCCALAWFNELIDEVDRNMVKSDGFMTQGEFKNDNLNLDYNPNHKGKGAGGGQFTFAPGSNGALTKEAASARFPDEKWVKHSKGVYVAESRKALANNIDNERKKLDKEFEQAEILAKQGHIIFLTPETGDGKQFDGFINGNQTIDLKRVESAKERAIGENFRDGAKKAEIIFLETKNNFPRELIFRKIRGEVNDMRKRGTEIKTKEVWIKIQDAKIYTLYTKDLL